MKSLLLGVILSLAMALSGCSSRCQVNGCRVRMEHKHGGEVFKSRVRRWYTYQNPRVGRDHKRDIPPDKIPWIVEPVEPGEESLMAGTDSTWTDLDGDPFADEFMDGDSTGTVGEGPQGKKKKKKKKKGDEEEEEALDPFFYGDDFDEEKDSDVIDW